MSDIIGKKFGKLLVEEKIKDDKGRTRYLCKCDCGGEAKVFKQNLVSGATKSCGCLRVIPRSLDLVGQTFGRLTVIKKVSKNSYNMNRFLCKCVCGNEKIVIGSNLVAGNVKSCGCLRGGISNIIGNKYGRLTVKEFYKYIDGSHYYKCDCDCGTKGTLVRRSALIHGGTKSCGCLRFKSVRMEFNKEMKENE